MKITLNRRFTNGIDDPFSYFKWVSRTAKISDSEGNVKFEAKNLEFPEGWSQSAVDITTTKYFRVVETEDGSLVAELSAAAMIRRVVETLTRWGLEQNYFDEDGAKIFFDELVYALCDQKVAFNSPVWFNVGTKRGRQGEEQCSACFINSVDDDMQSILNLAVVEGRLYKGGSGSGVNYSRLRSSREALSGGGCASGPIPFIQKDDANAGAIKSGGTTRRAAKMVILDIDHGDICEFIDSKAVAEKKAAALIDAGFNSDFTARGGVYDGLPFQNANHTVRVTDEFLRAVKNGGDFKLRARNGKVLEVVKAKDLWRQIAVAAHTCGDPGLHFTDMIDAWHTTPFYGPIRASNPCSEYMSNDDTSCNLASINICKHLNPDDSLDHDAFVHTINIVYLAQDILIDKAGYPTEKIAKNSKAYRQIGLGYANLGAWFMRLGISYDSDQARSLASVVTALMTGTAYTRSAEIASVLGPFEHFDINRDTMLQVMQKHELAYADIDDKCLDKIHRATYIRGLHAVATANQAVIKHGARNSQATVIAPTGTIAFMMDCDTTGIEPDAALVKTKKLVGGGTMTIVNQSVTRALMKLGYTDELLLKDIKAYILKNSSVVGSGINKNDYPVFDCAFSENIASRCLRPEAHVLMLAAVQPFVSGSISKTVNLSNSATVEDIERIYMLAWEKGLKCIALYRDGCKRTQPLSTIQNTDGPPKAVRNKLPDTRNSVTHKFSIGGHEGYLQVGLYNDGQPGEIFVKMAKEGSTISGLMDSFATAVSLGLQHGVPLQLLVDKLTYTNFEPKGLTGNSDIPRATSIMDYIFKWIEKKYLGKKDEEEVLLPKSKSVNSGITCSYCGATMRQTGTCKTCESCGKSGGC